MEIRVWAAAGDCICTWLTHRHMDKARYFLEKVTGGDESDRVSRLTFPAHLPHAPSFYEYFVLRGIHLDRVEPGSLSCSFKVPPRLTVRHP